MAEAESQRKGEKIEGAKLILLDIEGTVCPISYVKDTLFPYATQALPTVLAKQWDSPDFQPYRLAAPEAARETPESYIAAVKDLTAANSKIAWLKNLQGYLWEDGYKTGAYSTPLFPDVAPWLKRWKGDGEAGLKLAIYSSGSVFAQKLLFAHVQRQQQVVGESAVDETPAATASRKRGRSDDDVNGEAEDSAGNGVDGYAPSKKRLALPPKDGEAAGDANSQALVGADKDDVVGEDGEDGAAFTKKPAAVAEQPKGAEDLTGLFEGWFDTTNAGPKTEAKSYEVIAGEMKACESARFEDVLQLMFSQLNPEEILFFSDNVKEIEAAEKAQMKAILVDRPGNAPLDEADVMKYHLVKSFDEVEL